MFSIDLNEYIKTEIKNGDSDRLDMTYSQKEKIIEEVLIYYNEERNDRELNFSQSELYIYLMDMINDISFWLDSDDKICIVDENYREYRMDVMEFFMTKIKDYFR